MNSLRIITILAAMGILTHCGGKDDALFLFPFAGEVTADAATVPGVPSGDLNSASTGNASGDGNVTAITGDSATPPDNSSTTGSGDSGSTGSGDSGSTGSGDSGSTGSGDSGSTGGDSGSTGSGDSGSTGSGDSGSTGSGDSGSTGGDSGTTGSGDSGSTGSGDSGSTGGDSGSTGGDSGSTGSGDSGSTGSGDANTVTSGTKVGSDYSHIDGTWYQDGTTMFTYQQDKAIGYTFANLKDGRYRITLNAKHWVKHDSSQNLPDGFSNFNVSIAGSGGAQVISIPASSTAFQTGSVELDLAAGSNQLLLNFLNASCGSESGYADNGGKTAICHIPPGNPSAQHTITVGSGAVKAHMKHGDKMGSCTVCTNLQIHSISIERIGDASGGLAAFLQGARSNRSVVTAVVILGIALLGLFLIGRMKSRAA